MCRSSFYLDQPKKETHNSPAYEFMQLYAIEIGLFGGIPEFSFFVKSSMAFGIHFGSITDAK